MEAFSGLDDRFSFSKLTREEEIAEVAFYDKYFNHQPEEEEAAFKEEDYDEGDERVSEKLGVEEITKMFKHKYRNGRTQKKRKIVRQKNETHLPLSARVLKVLPAFLLSNPDQSVLPLPSRFLQQNHYFAAFAELLFVEARSIVKDTLSKVRMKRVQTFPRWLGEIGELRNTGARRGGTTDVVVKLIARHNAPKQAETEFFRPGTVLLLSPSSRSGFATQNKKKGLATGEVLQSCFFAFFATRDYSAAGVSTEILVEASSKWVRSGKYDIIGLCGILQLLRCHAVCLDKPQVPFLDSILRGSYRRRVTFDEFGEQVEDADVSEVARTALGATNLNASQRRAVSACLDSSKPVVLVQGPPGTGKTTTLVEAIVCALQAHERRLLVCAPTNYAVQVLLQACLPRLRSSAFEEPPVVAYLAVEELGNHESVRNVFVYSYVTDLQDLGRAISTKISQANGLQASPSSLKPDICVLLKRLLAMTFRTCKTTSSSLVKAATSLRQHFDDNRICEDEPSWWNEAVHLATELAGVVTKLTSRPDAVEKALLEAADVVFCTLDMAGRKTLRSCQNRFDLLLIDEAANAMEPACLIPLASLPRKLCLTGDPKQLGAFVTSFVCKNAGLDKSMMHRMMQCNFPVNLLDIQYRMHPSISSFPNKRFYNSLISNGANAEQSSVASSVFGGAYRVINVDGTEKRSKQGSFYNEREAEAAATLARVYLSKGSSEPADLAIITFYQAQASCIRRELAKCEIEGVDVGTVDAFQGSEKKVVFVSFVRANQRQVIGFVQDFRRLNVALTRAKACCLILMNSQTFTQSAGSTSSDISALVKDAQERGVFSEAFQINKGAVSWERGPEPKFSNRDESSPSCCSVSLPASIVLPPQTTKNRRKRRRPHKKRCV